MKKEIKHNYNGCSNFYKYEFNSIHEFYDFITKTPTNKAFKGYSLCSKRHEYGYKWYGTEDWTECIDLLHNGWEDGSKKITQRLKDLSKMDCDNFTRKTIYDIVGFQPSVPRYLQGVPTNMINQKLVPQKQKVVTISKSIAFTSGYSEEQIVDFSAKCLRIVKKIEQQGVRCNLNILNVDRCGSDGLMVKVRVKNANERLNIGKLAFLMAHPSVKRRLIFRFVETFEECSRKWTSVYGYSVMSQNELKRFAEKNEIILPSVVDFDEDSIKDLNSLVGK